MGRGAAVLNGVVREPSLKRGRERRRQICVWMAWVLLEVNEVVAERHWESTGTEPLGDKCPHPLFLAASRLLGRSEKQGEPL